MKDELKKKEKAEKKETKKKDEKKIDIPTADPTIEKIGTLEVEVIEAKFASPESIYTILKDNAFMPVTIGYIKFMDPEDKKKRSLYFPIQARYTDIFETAVGMESCGVRYEGVCPLTVQNSIRIPKLFIEYNVKEKPKIPKNSRTVVFKSPDVQKEHPTILVKIVRPNPEIADAYLLPDYISGVFTISDSLPVFTAIPSLYIFNALKSMWTSEEVDENQERSFKLQVI